MTGQNVDTEKITRYFNGEYSEKDASYVEEVFISKKSEEDLSHFLLRQFNESSTEDLDDERNLDHILYRIHYDINTRLSKHDLFPFRKIVKWTLRIAGIMMLPVIIFIGIQTYNDTLTRKETWIEINAPAWTRAKFSLPDGTTGWLNSSSSMKFNGNFKVDRQVTLNGEAFFDVFKDKTSPFIVNTNDIVVKVLGTRFNIASYENERNVEVVLEEGKLVFNDKELENSLIMSTNDMVIFDKTQKQLSVKLVEPKKYLSWTEGKLVFRNDPIDVIARRLERWYNIDVEVSGCVSDSLRLRATFIDDNLEEVLSLLKRSLPVDYTIESTNLNPDETLIKKKVIISARTK